MTAATPPTRAGVVALARRWIGTPYHHQASRLGTGTDCVGLVRGVWRALYGEDPESLPGYSADWAEATGEETLLAAARRHLVPVEIAAAAPGDVLVFRYRPHTIAKHTGILADAGASAVRAGIGPDPAAARLSLIHAVEGFPVAEVPLSPWWRRRIVAAFSFPGIID